MQSSTTGSVPPARLLRAAVAAAPLPGVGGSHLAHVLRAALGRLGGPPAAPAPRPGTPAFERLRRSWYERADPFGEDLEDARTPDAPLSSRGTIVTRAPESSAHSRTPEQVSDREAFMHEAERFLASHRFRNDRERRIWLGVSRGEAARDVALEIRMRKGDVLKVIRRLKETMRLRLEDAGATG